jgi:hypothetical protein
MPGERIGIRQDHLRVVIADLLVFVAIRLAWRLDLRTVGDLLLPVLLVRLLDMPSLLWVGIGAYLLAIGDSLDDGDRELQQLSHS